MALLAVAAVAQNGQFAVPYSTHDWESTNGIANPRAEVWADVKSPGNGRTYAVGSTDSENTTASGEFSGRPCSPSGNSGRTTPQGPGQVVVLQVTEANISPTPGTDTYNNIVVQKFFHGTTANTSYGYQYRAANARGISVWPAPTPQDTRVAICGDSYDEELPLSQVGGPWNSGTTNQFFHPTGFIAVYDGNLNLLWSYQFYGTATDRDCAITDVSIRVEGTGETARDIVTYCGISSHGVPEDSSPLSPNWPFAAPTGGPGSRSSGAWDHNSDAAALSKWDGIVGRLSNAHQSPVATATVQHFHSIVGSSAQDGLFGIDELDAERFVVVGGTLQDQPGSPLMAFPFTDTTVNWNTIGVHAVGTMLVFDATQADANTGNLILELAYNLGNASASLGSTARDVWVQRNYYSGALPRFFVVGSTTDAGLHQNVGTVAQTLYAGFGKGAGLDGFFADFADYAGTVVANAVGYSHDEEDVVYTGIGGWSEYRGEFTALGSASGGQYQLVDMVADRYHVAQAVHTYDPSLATPYLRRASIGGDGNDVPAAMGGLNATTQGLAWLTRGLGDPQGGGVAVNHLDQVHVVGGSSSLNQSYYTSPGARPQDIWSNDAVRTIFDMLPIGVSRTTGTGTRQGGVTAPRPPAGYAGLGGTTPVCALVHPQTSTPFHFGYQMGLSIVNTRRGITYLGAQPAPGVAPTLVLPFDGAAQFAVINTSISGPGLGFPNSTPDTVSVPGLEIWVQSSGATVVTTGSGWNGFAYFTPGSLPPGSFQVTFQAIYSAPNVCGQYQYMATPALTIDY